MLYLRTSNSSRLITRIMNSSDPKTTSPIFGQDKVPSDNINLGDNTAFHNSVNDLPHIDDLFKKED